jgi:hypothetical protein
MQTKTVQDSHLTAIPFRKNGTKASAGAIQRLFGLLRDAGEQSGTTDSTIMSLRTTKWSNQRSPLIIDIYKKNDRHIRNIRRADTLRARHIDKRVATLSAPISAKRETCLSHRLSPSHSKLAQ